MNKWAVAMIGVMKCPYAFYGGLIIEMIANDIM